MKKSILLLTTGILIAVITGVTVYQLQQYKVKPEAGPVVVENPYVVPEKPLIGAVRPDFEMQDVNGRQRHVNEWDGKILVINFWATWCGPCLTEIPAFIRLQDKYENQGLQFVGVALHTAEEIRDYISEAGMNYPALVGEEKAISVSRSFGNRFGVMPYTVFIDRGKRIYFIKSGPLKPEDTEAIIKSILFED